MTDKPIKNKSKIENKTNIVVNDIFCEKCDNILDVSRTSLTKEEVDLNDSQPTDTIESESTENKIVVDYENILRKVENDEKLTNEELSSIDIKDMVKDDYYKKLGKKGKIKTQIMEMIDDMRNSDENTSAYLVCQNCAFTKPIKSGLHILTKNPEGVPATHDYINESNYRVRVNMRTMPRTRNFTCQNKNCKGLMQSLPQEAIFFRKSADSYETIYVCTHCLAIKIN